MKHFAFLALASAALTLAAAEPPLVGPFETVSRFFHDDFEKPAERRGSPKIVQGVVSKGLLVTTKTGVYTTDSEIEAGGTGVFSMPKGSGRYFRTMFRLYEFTPGAAVSLRFTSGGKSARRCIVTAKSAAKIAASLPVEVEYVAAADGRCLCTLRSLADGSVQRREGKDDFLAALSGAGFGATVLLEAEGGEAMMRIDEIACEEVKKSAADLSVPDFIVEKLPEFDAARAGWRLVFEDEFEGAAGEKCDTSKWYVPSWRMADEGYARLDGEGHLAMTCDYRPGTTNLASGSLWSQESWAYGYFEARLKFTRNNGWWAAFWLYGESNFNAMECGSEIDIFEDYYTRYRNEVEEHPGTLPLDHNLHAFFGPSLKSFNQKSYAPGSLDDWHTIGCRWTPFEVSIYVDGRLVSSFDAFHHNAYRAPLHVICSGQIFRGWGPRDTTGFTFPERYLVDRVRVYEYPRAGAPSVRWTKKPVEGFVPEGRRVEFEAEVKPGADRIKAVYLFDNGAYLACRTEPPWRFELPFTREHFELTRFLMKGRQNKTIEWEGFMHSFEVFVQDEKGRVGMTDDHVHLLPAPASRPQPKGGVPRKVPGRVKATDFDDGGKLVSCRPFREKMNVCRNPDRVQYMHTGEWMSYTVEADKAGEYTAGVDFAANSKEKQLVLMLVDGVQVARFAKKTDERKVRLAAGRHVVTLVPVGFLSISGFSFR